MQKTTVTRFDNRVENYVKYRPHYPKEMLDFFRDELNLQESSVVADIGSGTGISAELFVENGNTVWGIEPNESMRKASEKHLKKFSNFKTIDATAENTTIEDKSVDFIVAAQAFHWFNNAKTLKEFRRILRNNGYVTLIWNERQLNSNEFLRGYEDFLIKFGIDYLKVRHDQVNQKTLESFFKTPAFLKTIENHQTLDFQGLKGRILSSSYMPSENHPLFEKMVKNLKSLFAEYEEKGKITILYNTNVFYAKL